MRSSTVDEEKRSDDEVFDLSGHKISSKDSHLDVSIYFQAFGIQQ